MYQKQKVPHKIKDQTSFVLSDITILFLTILTRYFSFLQQLYYFVKYIIPNFLIIFLGIYSRIYKL